jgi:glycerol-3-phosphate O-acyltransferase
MKLHINKSTTIAEMQTEFSKLFPFLKIEFFTRPREADGSLWSKHMVFNHNKTMDEVGQLKANENTIEVSPSMTVNTFEQNLQKDFGLSVQVFRKSMGSWIATTESDSWTFAVQNEKGEEAATNIPEMVYIGRDNQED